MNGVPNRHRLQNAQARRKKTPAANLEHSEVQREKHLSSLSIHAVVWLSGSDLLMRAPLRHQAPAVHLNTPHSAILTRWPIVRSSGYAEHW
jgi:hypothetical protein